MRNLNNLLDNEDVLDINNTYPGVIVRKGMGLLFVFFVVLLTIMAFIPYPEKVEVSAVINPVSRKFIFNSDTSRYKIQSVLKNNGDRVLREEKIAILADSTNHITLSKTLLAPFDGLFYKEPGKDGGAVSVIQLNKELTTITAIASSNNLSSVHLQEKVQIKMDDKEVSFTGTVRSITPIPFDTKSNIKVIISDSEKDRFEGLIKQNPAHSINVMLEIYDNRVSVLNKAFGVLGNKLKPF